MNSANSLFLSVESLEPGKGGIARVARLMAKIIDENSGGIIHKYKVLSLSDDYSATPFEQNSQTVNGSYVKYVLHNNFARLKYNLFLYDFLGVMRSHNLLPLLPKRPAMVWAHGIEIWETARACHISALRKAEYVLFNSNYTRQKVEALHGRVRNCHVCPLGTETDDIPEGTVPYVLRKPDVIIVARMEKGRDKGHRSLVRIWPEVLTKIPDAKLKIVGKGNDMEHIRKMADMSSARASIDFLGYVSDEELDDFYKKARLFVMPSHGEGFGIVYIEAMRHGLPVIGSVYDAAGEVILNGNTGLTVDSDDGRELAEAITGLLGNPEKAGAMGEQGFSRWKTHFSYSAFKHRFMHHMDAFISDCA